MISIILAGHGRAASGLYEAITQIFGAQDNLTVIDFPDGASQALLQNDLETAINRCTGGVVVFTDLLGGSPFRHASLIAETRPDTEVIAGMNLAMFAETLLDLDTIPDARNLCEIAVGAGRAGIASYAQCRELERKQARVTDGI